MDPAAKPDHADPAWNWKHLLALLGANVALALGPWWVRLADTGPVSAGFWRLALAIPLLAVLARANRQPVLGIPPRFMAMVVAGGVFFALDIAAWHVGIGLTRMGNATLFGNSGSLILMIWGIVALRRLPRRFETLAILFAVAGTAILVGESLELGKATAAGDLFSLVAGFFYAFYLVLLQGARREIGSWSLLFWSSAAGAPVLLGLAMYLGEPVWPQAWWPVVVLSLTSQVLGQGLLVYALRHFPPLVIGLTLLTQPAIGTLIGVTVFGESISAADIAGMAMVGLALVIVRAR